MIGGNVNEWFLAECEIEVAVKWRDVHEYALGSRGAVLSAKQRAYVAQFATTPLKLQTVTQVRRGEGLTPVDALDAESAPVVVQREKGAGITMPRVVILRSRHGNQSDLQGANHDPQAHS